MEQVQYVSDENNNVTSVIVPIGFWEKIKSEKSNLSVKKNNEIKDEEDMKKGKQSRNFGTMRDNVKIIGDIISPVSNENDWEAIKI